METDIVKLILALTAVGSLSLNAYQFLSSRGRLRVSAGFGHTPKEDGLGNRFVLEVAISNTGRAPIYFSGLKAVTKNGDYFFPAFDVVGGTKIEVGESIVGNVPAGHMLNQEVRALIALDGVWNEYRVPRRKLKTALSELAAEASRLKGLGFSLT